jgi:hypothetical protein
VDGTRGLPNEAIGQPLINPSQSQIIATTHAALSATRQLSKWITVPLEHCRKDEPSLAAKWGSTEVVSKWFPC